LLRHSHHTKSGIGSHLARKSCTLEEAARYAKDLFEPVELRLEGGDNMNGLLLTGGAKRLGVGAMTHVRPLNHRLDEEVEDVELNLAL
ncbi:hypothetical protein BGZ65_010192, partial [Modicella reniformis]